MNIWTYFLHVLGIRPNLALTLGSLEKMTDSLEKVATRETSEIAKHQAKLAASQAAKTRAEQVRTNMNTLLGN
jgi:hypothetical protein